MSRLKRILENPAFALANSVLAILISVAGLYFGYEAYVLSRVQYKQDRSLILKGSFDDKEKSIHVAPVDDGAHFMRGEVYFPSSIGSEPEKIDPAGLIRGMGSVQSRIEQLFSQRHPAKEGYVQIGEADIPVIIVAYYTSKGEAYTDVSLYMLSMMIVVGAAQYDSPRITFNGLTFVNRFDGFVRDAPVALEALLGKIDALSIPYQKP